MNGKKANFVIIDDPKGEPTSFDLFLDFIKKMQKRNISGLSVTMNGKKYEYSVKDDKFPNK